MRKCFTINSSRTTDEIKTYYQLFDLNYYQAIEIFYPYSYGEARVEEYTKDIKELLNHFKNIEIVMHLPHGIKNNLCDLENYQKIITIMENAIDYANKLGIKKLTLHLGIVDVFIDRNIYLDHINNCLIHLCNYASNYKMNLMIENMPGISELGYSPTEILSIINRANQKNLKFILDTGHANISRYPINEYIDLLKDYLIHLHFSDNSGLRDEHARLGSGIIDFYKVIKLLKEINYQELYCLEIIYKDVDDLFANAKSLDIYDK